MYIVLFNVTSYCSGDSCTHCCCGCSGCYGNHPRLCVQMQSQVKEPAKAGFPEVHQPRGEEIEALASAVYAQRRSDMGISHPVACVSVGGGFDRDPHDGPPLNAFCRL